MDRRLVASRILQVDGVLLIIAAFLHFFSTPIVRQWLARTLTNETLRTISIDVALNHLLVGVLMIPFGISTLYSATGVRAGQRFAAIIALVNGFAVLALPLLPLLVSGPGYVGSDILFLIASVLNTGVALSIILSMFWLLPQSRHRG